MDLNVTTETMLVLNGTDDLPCGCREVLSDLVLPPYFVMFLSVLFLTGLSLAINALELKFRYKMSSRSIRTMAGTATLAALAAPPWWFLAPQVAYHIGHLGYILYQAMTKHNTSAWEEYELGYAVWVNGGASIFLVFGLAGSHYTKLMIEGEKKLAEELANPQSEFASQTDADNFRKQFLQVTSVIEMEEIQAKSEDKKTVMGDEEGWEKGARTKRLATLCVALCMLPAICTHIVPGLLGYIWVFAPLVCPLHFVALRFLIPRSRYLSLIGRIVVLDALLSIYAIALQDSFNFSLSFYNGANYFELVRDTIFHYHDASCFFCTMLNDVGTTLSAGSLF
eukprot:TRINITY_DN10149_c2_g1_i1.p1 TRINITY_DN10149_c2_g1~~TRINITY_DN10149_c2_g1_i1.p1  ORF type:complete len:338 (+),score=39.40 TRINITY_DN10149_c2_g1_i1:67-1080(+)